MLTIFTPTYNRDYILEHLYQSLCRQTNQNFTWLIVDDGSTDHTKDLISLWRNENRIKIHYVYQNNQGKSAAHNRGVKLTDTELFVCVDSDDYITEDAVEKILHKWSDLNKKASDIKGILAFRKSKSSEPITIFHPNGLDKDTLKGFYDKQIIQGDTMLIFRTDCLKQLEFPMFPGEKFVPEAYLYDRFDQLWRLALLPEYLYVCHYLDDGYTKNMAKLIARNPQGYLAYIEQRLSFEKNMKYKILDTIRYTAIAIHAEKKRKIQSAPYPGITILTFPFGVLFYMLRYQKYKE